MVKGRRILTFLVSINMRIVLNQYAAFAAAAAFSPSHTHTGCVSSRPSPSALQENRMGRSSSSSRLMLPPPSSLFGTSRAAMTRTRSPLIPPPPVPAAAAAAAVHRRIANIPCGIRMTTFSDRNENSRHNHDEPDDNKDVALQRVTAITYIRQMLTRLLPTMLIRTFLNPTTRRGIHRHRQRQRPSTNFHTQSNKTNKKNKRAVVASILFALSVSTSTPWYRTKPAFADVADGEFQSLRPGIGTDEVRTLTPSSSDTSPAAAAAGGITGIDKRSSTKILPKQQGQGDASTTSPASELTNEQRAKLDELLERRLQQQQQQQQRQQSGGSGGGPKKGDGRDDDDDDDDKKQQRRRRRRRRRSRGGISGAGKQKTKKNKWARKSQWDYGDEEDEEQPGLSDSTSTSSSSSTESTGESISRGTKDDDSYNNDNIEEEEEDDDDDSLLRLSEERIGRSRKKREFSANYRRISTKDRTSHQIKVVAGVLTPLLVIPAIRETVRWYREERYVQKAIDILEAQKREYFNITEGTADSDLEDELKGLKEGGNVTSSEDEDDDEDDQDDEDRPDEEEDDRRRPPRKPIRGGGGGGGDDDDEDGDDDGEGSGDLGYGKPSDEDIDRLKRMFNKK